MWSLNPIAMSPLVMLTIDLFEQCLIHQAPAQQPLLACTARWFRNVTGQEAIFPEAGSLLLVCTDVWQMWHPGQG